MIEREQIREWLREDSRQAREQWQQALRRFEEIKRAVPAGAPFSDNAERIAASQEYTQALQAHRDAAKRHSDFLFSGTVPLDFKRPV